MRLLVLRKYVSDNRLCPLFGMFRLDAITLLIHVEILSLKVVWIRRWLLRLRKGVSQFLACGCIELEYHTQHCNCHSVFWYVSYDS